MSSVGLGLCINMRNRAGNYSADAILYGVNNDLRKATAQTLDLAGFAVRAFGRAADALAALPSDFPGVIVSDIRMPEIDGLQLFAHIRERDRDLPVILITGHGDIAMAVQAIQDGVYDFITKPFAAERLVQSLRRAQEKRSLVLENKILRHAVETAGDDMPLIGQTSSMARLRHTLRQIADTDVDVLVRGESAGFARSGGTRQPRRARGRHRFTA
jgi:two-component system C4-dicarboxylate transport response regulator DctD